MAKKLAVVTGANRGIGLEIGRQLVEAGFAVLATSRSEPEGRAAAAEIGAEHRRLDVTSDEDVDALAASLGDGFDVLVNNAGIALDGFDAGVARRTIDVNVLGAIRVTDRLLPLLRQDARIVMVSSGLGDLSGVEPPLREQFAAPDLDRGALLALLESFVSHVGKGDHAKNGWPSSAYRVSKIGLNAYTRIVARELARDPRRILCNAACPGWVRTRMGGAGAPRSPEDGAKTPVFLALLPAGDGPTGTLFRDEHPVPF